MRKAQRPYAAGVPGVEEVEALPARPRWAYRIGVVAVEAEAEWRTPEYGLAPGAMPALCGELRYGLVPYCPVVGVVEPERPAFGGAAVL